MPLITCASCLAKFQSSGNRGTSCPTWGTIVGRSSAGGRPSSRKSRFDDDPPVRRRRTRARSSNNDAAVRTISGALIACGVLGLMTIVVFFIGGYFLFTTASGTMREAQREQQQYAQDQMDR